MNLRAWVKEQRNKGYTDDQLKKYLTKDYNSEDVNHALASKPKFDYKAIINAVGIPLLVVFVLSVAFQSFNFILLEEINDLFYFGIVILALALHAYLYHKKSESADFLSTFILFIISYFISTSVVLLLFYGLSFVVFFPFSSYSFLFLMLFFSLTIPTAIYTYFRLAKHFLEKKFGYYDHYAFLRFKYYPEKIFNIFSDKKSFTTTIVIVTIGVLLFSTISFFGLTYGFTISKVNQLGGQMVLHDDFSNYEFDISAIENSKISLTCFNGDGSATCIGSDQSIKYVHYNCNPSLNCNTKPYISEQNLLSEITQINSRGAIGANDSVYIIPEPVFDLFVRRPEIQKTIFAKEFSESYDEQIDFLVNYQEPDLSFMDVAIGSLNGDSLMYVTDLIKRLAIMGMHIGYSVSKASDLMRGEYQDYLENQNGNPYYDGTTSTQEHINKIRSNINKMKAEFNSKYPYREYVFDPKRGRNGAGFQVDVLIATGVFKKTHLVIGMTELDQFIGFHVSQFKNRGYIDKLDHEVQESELSKLLRYKVIESQMIGPLLLKCRDFGRASERDDCKENYFLLTKDISYFCKDSDIVCTLDHAVKQKDISLCSYTVESGKCRVKYDCTVNKNRTACINQFD